MLQQVFNFVISQSLIKQTSNRWTLCVLYLIMIFPSIILLSFAQSMEKNEKKRKKREQEKESFVNKFALDTLYYLCYFAPTMFLTCSIGIAAIGSTFCGYIPLFWLIIVFILIIMIIIDYYTYNKQERDKKNTKKTL